MMIHYYKTTLYNRKWKRKWRCVYARRASPWRNDNFSPQQMMHEFWNHHHMPHHHVSHTDTTTHNRREGPDLHTLCIRSSLIIMSIVGNYDDRQHHRTDFGSPFVTTKEVVWVEIYRRIVNVLILLECMSSYVAEMSKWYYVRRTSSTIHLRTVCGFVVGWRFEERRPRVLFIHASSSLSHHHEIQKIRAVFSS